jgi:hypothetical protein
MAFLKGDDTQDDREIGDKYLELRARLIPEFTTDQMLGMPKMVWKARSIFQCLIRRTLEAVDGMRMAWNAGNLLTAVTMARSLIETGAVVQGLIDAVKESTKEKDVEALDKAVMSAGFATRFEDFMGDDWAYKAKNVLTMIDAMDRGLFKDKLPRLRKAYDFLSEFVHPNHLGILGLYSDHLAEKHRIEFGNLGRKRANILSQIRITLAMVWLVENAASDLEALIPEISAFVPH